VWEVMGKNVMVKLGEKCFGVACCVTRLDKLPDRQPASCLCWRAVQALACLCGEVPGLAGA
jgi:hypothetical protein